MFYGYPYPYPQAQPIVVPQPQPIKLVPEEKDVKIPIVHSVPEFHNRKNRELHRHIYGDYPSDNYKVASTKAKQIPVKPKVTKAK